MIESMTGFGSGKSTQKGITVTVEIRSVNNRFVELSAKLPKILQNREGDLKEIIRTELNRGKITVNIQLEKESIDSTPLMVDTIMAKRYTKLLQQLILETGIQDEVKLDHLLKFNDIFISSSDENTNELEWEVTKIALKQAITSLREMRKAEGEALSKDFAYRIQLMRQTAEQVKKLSEGRSELERKKLQEKIASIITDDKINPDRLELEIALLCERLDITEELVRLDNHLDFFINAINEPTSSGRKLNFLVQEMNREVNTIGSKSNSSETAHLVVGLKEELERIREQLQNIE